MHKKSCFLILFFIFSSSFLYAQRSGYWQQEADYKMDIDFDVETNRFNGRQILIYTNNSPETLKRVFYHLYFNAFQPNSMMDKRSRTIEDPDGRVRDRIVHYDESEIGYQEVKSLTQNGSEVDFTVKGTVMEVHLNEPINPGTETVFEMEFNAQVPLQTRRSGRDNSEGIRYSMSQWYPKIAEYDHMGWHPTPYIAREFHGVFGNFDITIHIDRNYVVSGTGYLQNPRQVGYGYEKADQQIQKPSGGKLSWHFLSDYQHDFMWAADPDYTHVTAKVPNGPLLRFFYQTDPVAENADEEQQDQLLANWEKLPEFTVKAFEYMNEHFGEYPYDEYMVIQGGDGGMEYIMGTLITGNRSLGSLVGVTVHELVHAWYQGVLANNESYYHWMDEGFTSYASNRVMSELFPERAGDPFAGNYRGYRTIANSGIEESMHTHADHFERNRAYGMAAYTKGAIFLHQLSYIIGQEVFDRGMKRYFEEWKFKHPGGRDFIRIMEKESNMGLDWYYDYWITSTKTIDYSISEVAKDANETEIKLGKIGLMPMPLDIEVEYTSGEIEHFYIPIRIMWGKKSNEYDEFDRTKLEDWPWVFPTYSFTIDRPLESIERIEIDPSKRMADVNPDNNIYLHQTGDSN